MKNSGLRADASGKSHLICIISQHFCDFYDFSAGKLQWHNFFIVIQTVTRNMQGAGKILTHVTWLEQRSI